MTYSFRASPGNVAEIEHLLYGENDVIRQVTFKSPLIIFLDLNLVGSESF
jgi:hypothetical protein